MVQVGQQQGPIDPRSRAKTQYELPEPGQQQGAFRQWMDVPGAQRQPWQVTLTLRPARTYNGSLLIVCDEGASPLLHGAPAA